MKPRRIVALSAFIAAGLPGSAALHGQAAAPSSQFEGSVDIGDTAQRGSVARDAASATYRITAGGANIWGGKDAFHFLWTRRPAGDLHVAADIAFVGTGGDPHRKAGVMIREKLTPGSRYADVMIHGDGLAALQYRDEQDGPTRQIVSNVKAPRGIRLEREGDYVFFSLRGADGLWYHAGGNFRIALGEAYVGLAVSAHDNKASETAVFSNVALTVPVLAHVPDTGYPAKVESTLETMQVTGEQSRTVVRHFAGKIEAPNWTRDGSSLVYNSNGRIYRIPATGGEPVAIDTGRHLKNNNDHGLSPDGTQLIISDQIEPDNLSRIHVLPLSGSGAPREVVSHADARSYWHGWSPDGKTIAYVYVHTKNGTYDIRSRPLAGGPDRMLITGPGTDDGPEYSPDGRYLYFNSTRSGAMQLWRANGADGTNPERITHDDAYRDWFPHLSPDGKWIAFVSFGLDVAVGDHPPNRDVLLRIMPTDRSAPPRVLTRLFGGQGTINVPSWSPDGRMLAFVSNSDLR